MKNKPIKHIDASGLLCPMPLMLLKKAMSEINAGEQLSIAVTDEHAELDFQTWCERFGHGLERLEDQADELWFLVVKRTTMT
jgi:tRNA 2-thiouridine synthesizing protein A